MCPALVRQICRLRSVGAGEWATASGHPAGEQRRSSLRRQCAFPEDHSSTAESGEQLPWVAPVGRLDKASEGLLPGNQRFGMGRAHCRARDASGQDIPRADRQGRRRSLDAIATRRVTDEGGGNAATCSCKKLSGSSIGPLDATRLFPRIPPAKSKAWPKPSLLSLRWWLVP
jgi:hypothetical protein